MASIPLGSAQIRLGNNFNQQFYYGDSNSAQLNMNNEYMRDYSIGVYSYGESYTYTDPIPFTSGAQRSLSMYRGGCGRYPDTETTNASVADNNQALAYESGGGPASFSSWAKTTNPNLIGTGSADQAGTNIIAQYVNGNSTGQNSAANLVADFGYLEPGSYLLSFEGGHYNTGVHYCIIRGYTGEHLSGSSSNYRVITKNCSWSGGWTNSSLGTGGASFTVNSTYPYVIMSLESHLDDPYYLNTAVNRKDTSNGQGATNRRVNPNIWRVS